MSSESSDFQSLLNTALVGYTERTGIDLLGHQLTAKLKSCTTADTIIAVLYDQARPFDDLQNGDHTTHVLRQIKPIVNALLTLFVDGALREGPSLPFAPDKVILSGIGILVSATEDPGASYDALIDFFQYIGNVFECVRIYTKVSSTVATTETILKTFVEVILALALATKQIGDGKLQKYGDMLLEETDIEEALEALEGIVQEEARSTATQLLELVYGLIYNLRIVMEGAPLSADPIRRPLGVMQKAQKGEKKLRRDQMQASCKSWLSAPDPSANYYFGCNTRVPGTKDWFIHSNVFEGWRKNGSLLWICDKAATGKTTLCSLIIEDLERLRITELACVVYFYFDYREPKKQGIRGLLSSLLVQLCAQSDVCRGVLSTLYLARSHEIRQPNIQTLTQCLKDMLAHLSSDSVYIIIDGLNECPTGLPSPRGEILRLLKGIGALRYPNLHICILSRAEPDIKAALDPLTSHHASLHGESGQEKDIAAYVKSLIDSDTRMKKWPPKDKVYVIETLGRRSLGVFEWACRHLLPLREYLRRSIRPHVDGASQVLYEAYEDVLQNISPQNEECAHHMFECLVVAARHLRFREFAEVITMDFETDGRLFKFEMNWREDNLEGAIHIIATKLVGITDFNNDRYAQLAHLAVREFLTSDQILRSEKERIPYFHVKVGPAHITFAQVCLAVLLELKDISREKIRNYPLAGYAAEYWAHHAKSGGWAAPIDDATKRLFDPQEPYFAAWVWLHDVDSPLRGSMITECPETPTATPLYYAARCGLDRVVERLAAADPDSVNTLGGTFGTPLQAAAAVGSLDSVRSLLQYGAVIDMQAGTYGTALQAAAAHGAVEVIQLLVESEADVNAQGGHYGTAMKAAKAGDSLVIVELLHRSGAV